MGKRVRIVIDGQDNYQLYGDVVGESTTLFAEIHRAPWPSASQPSPRASRNCDRPARSNSCNCQPFSLGLHRFPGPLLSPTRGPAEAPAGLGNHSRTAVSRQKVVGLTVATIWGRHLAEVERRGVGGMVGASACPQWGAATLRGAGVAGHAGPWHRTLGMSCRLG